SGIQGRLFAPLGIAYILAILASLLVALTITPALCLALLPKRAHIDRTPRYVGYLKGRYRSALERISEHPKAVLTTVAALCLRALTMLPFFGGAFLPELREGHCIVHMSAVPGTSPESSLRMGTSVIKELEQHA